MLRGQLKTLDAAIHTTKWPALDILPAGDCEFENARGLLTGQAMLTVLQTMRSRYDHILIDAPPALAADGGPELASMADQTLLVVKMRVTPAEQSERAKRVLKAANAPIAGVIVDHG